MFQQKYFWPPWLFHNSSTGVCVCWGKGGAGWLRLAPVLHGCWLLSNSSCRYWSLARPWKCWDTAGHVTVKPLLWRPNSWLPADARLLLGIWTGSLYTLVLYSGSKTFWSLLESRKKFSGSFGHVLKAQAPLRKYFLHKYTFIIWLLYIFVVIFVLLVFTQCV